MTTSKQCIECWHSYWSHTKNDYIGGLLCDHPDIPKRQEADGDDWYAQTNWEFQCHKGTLFLPRPSPRYRWHHPRWRQLRPAIMALT